MYPTWLRITRRPWTTTLLLLAILAAVMGGVQTAAAQPEPPAVPEQPARLLLPLMMNGASPDQQIDGQTGNQADNLIVTQAYATVTGATIASDLPDYAPGASVLLTGIGWQPGETVHIAVNDQAGQSWSLDSSPDPVADSNGSFTYGFQLPNWFVAVYGVSATGPSSGMATATFTDEDLSWDQCQNDTNPNDNKQDLCVWGNGALNTNNSIYAEGDVVPQRHIRGVSATGDHFTIFDHSFYDKAKDAFTYDFWATPDFTLKDKLNPCSDLANSLGLTLAQCNTLFDAKMAVPIPPEETYNVGGTQYTYPFVGGAELNAAADLVTRNLWISCGTVGGTKQNPTFTTGTCTNISITMLGHGDSNKSLLPPAQQQGPPTADEYVQMKVSYTTPGSTFVAIWVGGHLAKGSYWNDPQIITNSAFLGYGSSSAAGASFHQRLNGWDLNSAIGTRDNQIQNSGGTIVPPGSITIVKDDAIDSSTPFPFTAGAPLSPGSFTLCDPATSGCASSQVFSNLFTGAYAVSENLPQGWTLSRKSCIGTTSTYEYTASGVTINLQPGDNVTCTFTNVRTYNKDLTVSKTATAAYNRTFAWLIDKSVDDTRIEIAEGGNATFKYSVKVAPAGYTDSGWTVGGKITVANPNNFAIAGVSVTDAIDTGGTCTVTGGSNVTVPANDKVVLDYTCTYGSAPTTAGGTNTATATWGAAAYNTPMGSASGTAVVDFATVTPAATNGTITVVDDKTVPASPATLGTWNWGDGEHIFTYSLDKPGVAGKCTDYTNTAKIAETGQFDSQMVTVCIGKDLAVSKTVAGTFARAYSWQVSKNVDQTLVKMADGGSHTFHYTVDVAQTGVTDANWKVSGKISLTNPNDWEDITLTNLSDAVDNGGACIVEPGPYKVLAGKTLDIDYSCSYASAPGSNSGTNTATATWDAAAAFTPSGSASGSASFTLTQLGTTNKTVHVTDSYGGNLGTVTATDSTPFATATFTYDRTESGAAGTCTSYNNIATISETSQSDSKSVTLCVGKDLTLTKTAEGSFNRTYLWQVSKNVDQTLVKMADGGSYTFHYTVDVAQTGISDAGWTLSGKILLTNPNDWEDITLTDLSDAVSSGGVCIVAAGPYVVPKGGSLDVNYSCSYASAPSSYSGTNTATATWDAAAAFTPGDSASGSASFTLAQLGTTNKAIHVTDSFKGNLGTVTAKDSAPFATGTFTYDRTVSGVAGKCTSYDNTATIVETDQSASQTTRVCVGKDLTVIKTAVGTFDRTYLWKINKVADQTTVNIAEGGSYTFNYTVGVEQTGVSDSGWTLSGMISLTNPNDWEDITLTNLSDVMDNGGTCSVDPGPYKVLAGKTLDVNYSCSYASAPSSYTGTNTVAATWDKALAFTPTGAANGSAPFTLAQLGATNKTVHVTDSFKGILGTVTATDVAPFATAAFTYARAESGAAGKCTSYDNTATIVETNQTASKTVTICVGKDLTVSKTATPSFTRTWSWNIVKDSDGTYNLFAGDTVTHGYKVAVTPSYADSLWQVVGKITLTNPNDWEEIKVAGLVDLVNNGGTCTVDQGPYVVPAGTAIEVGYSCTYASAPSKDDGVNTASATWDNEVYFTPTGTASGSTGFTFENPTEVNPSITVDDDNLTGENWSANRAAAIWEYTKNFACSTDASKYTDGKYSYSLTNTAEINETGAKDTARVDVNCYAPVVTKDVTTYFNRDWDWTITKDYDATYNLFAGGSVTHGYKVVVDPKYTDNLWGVKGNITVANGHPTEAMVLASVNDLAGGIAGVVSCPSLTVPAAGSLICTYNTGPQTAPNANPFGNLNTATAVFARANWTGTAPIAFSTTPTTEDQPVITVDDDNLSGEIWTANRSVGEWTYTKDFACSTDTAAYKDGKYSYSLTNTATIKETGQTDSAKVDVNCYAPKVTKTAVSYWNRDWDWTITKDSDASYNLFAGDTVTHGYKVAVEPTYTDNFWGVKGTITVYNYHPTEAMTLANLTDLAGGINGVVTCDDLVVPAKGSLTCTYDTGAQDMPKANPFGNLNTATAAFAGVNWTGTAPIAFSATPTTEHEPIITVDDNNLTGEVWSADRAYAEWTYTKPFACSSKLADYSDGTYSYSVTNTATINETGQTDTAKVDANCYWPQIELTKTGDALSKIGDGVSYTIKLQNNTPTEAGVRALSCLISDELIGVSRSVTLASSGSDTSTKAFTIPTGASDPFLNTASVTCKPVATTAPVVGSSTFSVVDSSTWSTNLFQPKVEIVKTGPAYATSGDKIVYSFTINNLSSSDSPNLVLNTLKDTVLGDLETAAVTAGCDNLAYNGTCTFTASYTVPDVGLQPTTIKNIVTVHYHPAGFTNDIMDTDDHTVMATPRSQLTDTSFCPLANNQFRLLYHLETAPNIYRLQASNPGQYYFNGFYYGTPGSNFEMTLKVPYPFVTQEGAGNPIQVHDGTSLTSGGCYSPNPSLGGFTIATDALSPKSSAGNQIITPEDYTTKNLGNYTTVTVIGTVPATGMAYVTIHLDYGLKKTGGWVPGGSIVNPVSGASIANVSNGTIVIHGYEVYNFSRMVDSEISTTTPSSYNEIKKFAGFLGFMTDKTTGRPIANGKITIYDPSNKLLTTQYTDADGYYMYAYKHKSKAATYTIKAPAYGKSIAVTVKANGFAAADFDVDAMTAAIEAPDDGADIAFIFMPMVKP